MMMDEGLHNQDGMALIITLLVLALLTAMVVEFSYAVYTGTSNLYNWRDSQRLSLMAKSGVNVSARLLKELKDLEAYKTKSRIEMPVENPFEDFQGTVTVRIEDEEAKFNVNTILAPNGEKKTYKAFGRLLEILDLDPKIADRIADWIVEKRRSPVSASAEVKTVGLTSVDELLLIPDISGEAYDKLLPYITALPKNDLEININTADIAVLMCVAERISEGQAKQIIARREIAPLTSQSFFEITDTLP
ncbi:MAG: type II secretion system minor pseudopilin GspK, partial [Nitrospirota bacterium]